MMYEAQETLSRHRLPQPYRGLLVALWLAPIALLLLTIMFGVGLQAALAFFDPRFLILITLMALPAFYIWQEGVDVLNTGIRRRIYLPRTYAYGELSHWSLRQEKEGRILMICDDEQHTVISTHAAHLTDLPSLLVALRENVTEIHR